MVLALLIFFFILAEFGHSDRNGGILRKKRKNSAKIGMVGSYDFKASKNFKASLELDFLLILLRIKPSFVFYFIFLNLKYLGSSSGPLKIGPHGLESTDLSTS